MRRRRSAILGLAVLALAAADGPGIAFRDDRAITISDGKPRTVVVCNSTSAEGTVTLGDFGASPAPLALDRTTAPPGCTDVTLTQTADAPDGKYTGVLAASAPGGGLARVAVTFEKGRGKAAAAHVTGALNSFELKGKFTRESPRDGDARLSDLVFTTSAKSPDLEKLTIHADIGVLDSGSGYALLKAAGPPRQIKDNVYRIPVYVSDAPGQGTYKGKLTALKDKDGNPPSVTVVVADHWILLVVAVLLGLLAGTLAKAASGRWLPGWWLGLRRGRLDRRYANKGAALCHGYVAPGKAQIDAFKQKNKEGFASYKKTVTLLDPAAPAFKAVKDQLTEAEKDAELVSKPAPLCASLDALDAAVADFAAQFPAAFPDEPAPSFATKAQGLLSGRQLGVGQATKVKAQADAAASLLADWSALAKGYLRVMAVRDAADSSHPNAVKADECIGLVRAALLDLGDTGALDKDEATDALRKAYALLASVPQVQQLGDMAGRSSQPWDRSAAGAAIEALEAPVAEAVKVGVGILGELFVAFITGGLTLLATTAALYSGKPFGSTADYLTAFTAAAAAQAVIGSVFTTVNSWRGTSTA